MDNGPGNVYRDAQTKKRQKRMGDPHYDNKTDIDPVEKEEADDER